MKHATLFGLGIALAALLGLTSPAGGATWHFETLDGAGGVNGRLNAAVGDEPAALVYQGAPHVWYQDGTSGDLRHGWWTGAQWAFETLDGAGGPNGRIVAFVGLNISVAVYAGAPHVWYYDESDGHLRHGWWTGAHWAFETLDGHQVTPAGQTNADVGFYSTVVLFGGVPHVLYTDSLNGNLRHAWWTGATWGFETLDGAGGPNGRIVADLGYYPAVTVAGAGPQVWYYDFGGGNLRHAWWTGATWRFETLDGHQFSFAGQTNADVGGYPSVAVLGAAPHAWYYDWDGGNLRHAWWTGAGWAFETLDGHQNGPAGRVLSDVGLYIATTVVAGAAHVWYYDSGAGNLRHAWWTGAGWAFETLDGHQFSFAGQANADVGDENDATVVGGSPHVFYHDVTGGNLRHAWYG